MVHIFLIIEKQKFAIFYALQILIPAKVTFFFENYLQKLKALLNFCVGRSKTLTTFHALIDHIKTSVNEKLGHEIQNHKLRALLMQLSQFVRSNLKP